MFQRVLPVVVSLYMLISVSAVVVCAEDAPPLLDEINRKVEEGESELAVLVEKRKAAEAELRSLKTAIDDLKFQQRDLEKQLEQQAAERDRVLSEIKTTDVRIARTRELSLTRVRAVYMNRPDMVVERLLAMEDSSKLARNAVFLRRVQEFDKMVLSRLAGLRLERDRRKQELERLLGEQREIQKTLKAKGQGVQSRISRREVILRDLKVQQAAIQVLLAGLRAQALRLETVVASLTGGEDREERVRKDRLTEDVSTAEEAFEGSGLKGQRGRLVSPVSGKVVKGFGRKSSSEFEDFVVSKGISFNTTEGAEVRAVAEGKVIFAGHMPRLGTVLIIDHGSRSYSLYGMLGEVAARRGEILYAGQKLGTTSSPAQSNGNFYFEIREQGKTVNPAGYFKNL